MRVTIKTQTRTGRPATPATEKQADLANQIVHTINAALDEIATKYPQYADQAAAEFDKMTDVVDAGPKDVIEYLMGVASRAVYNTCYMLARRDQNVQAVHDLNPMKLKLEA